MFNVTEDKREVMVLRGKLILLREHTQEILERKIDEIEPEDMRDCVEVLKQIELHRMTIKEQLESKRDYDISMKDISKYVDKLKNIIDRHNNELDELKSENASIQEKFQQGIVDDKPKIKYESFKEFAATKEELLGKFDDNEYEISLLESKLDMVKFRLRAVNALKRDFITCDYCGRIVGKRELDEFGGHCAECEVTINF